MALRRLFFLLPIALVLGSLCAPPRAARLAPGRLSARELTPGTAYAIATSGDYALFDLPSGNGMRYLLIVSSLGEASQSYAVRLAATESEEVVSFAASPIEPLNWHEVARRIRSGLSNVGAVKPVSNRSCPGAAQATREFHLHVTDGDLDDPQQYARIPGELISEGDEIRVYLDTQLRRDQLHAGLANEIVSCFERAVLPRSRRLLGNYYDVDGDGKFAVLITPWLDRLQGGRTSLGGMARSSDFRPAIDAPLSNHSDVLYLNANLRPNDHLRTLLAHEFAHVLCFSRRVAEASCPPEEDWLSEAIAHIAEDVHGFGWSNLDYRVERYLEEPQSAPLVVPDYYRAGLWRDPGCRGATYLFLRWCVDQWGEELLHRLATAPGRGRANLESVTGIPFEELYRRWSLAVLLSGHETPSGDPVCDRYQSIDLRGCLGKIQLAGPRFIPLEPDRSPADFQVKGTATAFVSLDPPADAQALRIEVRADPGAELQISLVCVAQDGGETCPPETIPARDRLAVANRSMAPQ